MKIRITKHIPVQPNIRPAIGEVYEVIQKQVGRSHLGKPNIIEVKGNEVGVWNDECQVVEENE